MEIIKNAPSYYIQHCEKCGAVLKYSECDIYVKNVHHDIRHLGLNTYSFSSTEDKIICPSCGNIFSANRKFFYEDIVQNNYQINKNELEMVRKHSFNIAVGLGGIREYLNSEIGIVGGDVKCAKYAEELSEKALEVHKFLLQLK